MATGWSRGTGSGQDQRHQEPLGLGGDLAAHPVPLSGGGEVQMEQRNVPAFAPLALVFAALPVLQGATRPALPQERAMMKPEPSRSQAGQLAARRTFLMNDPPPPPPPRPRPSPIRP